MFTSAIPARIIHIFMAANLLDALADYVKVLSTSMEKTTRAEDRSAYLRHLAAAALIFQSLNHSNLFKASEHVEAEQQDYGRSFLDGEEGKAAEAAFTRFLGIISREGLSG